MQKEIQEQLTYDSMYDSIENMWSLLFCHGIPHAERSALSFCEALKNGDAAECERLFNELMKRTASIRDTAVRKEFKENFYHGLILGILSVKGNWDVESNREAGDGYPDIAIAKIAFLQVSAKLELAYAQKTVPFL